MARRRLALAAAVASVLVAAPAHTAPGRPTVEAVRDPAAPGGGPRGGGAQDAARRPCCAPATPRWPTRRPPCVARQAENAEEAAALRAQIASLAGDLAAPRRRRRGAGPAAHAAAAQQPAARAGAALARERRRARADADGPATLARRQPPPLRRRAARAAAVPSAAGLPDRGRRPHPPAGRSGGQPAHHRLRRHRARRRHRGSRTPTAGPAWRGCWPACVSRPSTARRCGPTRSRCPGWGWRPASSRCSDTVTCRGR